MKPENEVKFHSFKVLKVCKSGNINVCLASLYRKKCFLESRQPRGFT